MQTRVDITALSHILVLICFIIISTLHVKLCAPEVEILRHMGKLFLNFDFNVINNFT